MSTVLFLWFVGCAEFISMECTVTTTPWSRTMDCGPAVHVLCTSILDEKSH